MPRETESATIEVEESAGMSAEGVYNFLRQSGADIGRIETPQDAMDVFDAAPAGEVLTYKRKFGGEISIRKLEDGSWENVQS